MLSFSCSFSLTACGAATVEPILGVAGEPTLIFIYTDGWPPWQAVAPIVDGLEASYTNQLAIQRVNAIEGDGPAIMQAYRVMGHPTILLLNAEGQEVQRFIGPTSAADLETAIESVLTNQ